MPRKNDSIQQSAFGIFEPFIITSSDKTPVHEEVFTPLEPEVIVSSEDESSKEFLDKEFVSIHDRITELFYKRKTMTTEEFESLHSACWLYHQKALIEHGHEKDYSVQEELWHPPKTRLDEINEMLGNLKLRKEDWHKHGCHDPNKFLPQKGKP